jgi:hypothetical protein
MEAPRPPQISVSGRIVIEGQLSEPSSGGPQNVPAPAPPSLWWKFWKGPPDTVLAKASVLTTIATIVLAGGTLGLAWVSLSQLFAFDSEATIRLRSYISIVATHTPIELGKPVIFTVVIQASGQTPAFDVVAQRGGARPFPYPLPSSMQFKDYEITDFQNLPNKVTLSPGNTISILNKTDIITKPSYDAINIQNTDRIYMWGRVTYRDVFRCRRWLNYCFVTNDTIEQTDICAQHNDPEGEPQVCPK